MFKSQGEISLNVQMYAYCNCIVTRGGVYDEILPDPEGNPEGGAEGSLCHGSFKSSLGNTLCLEDNIATVIFQYSIIR